MDFDKAKAAREFDEKVIVWIGGFLIGMATMFTGLIIYSFFH